MSTDVDSFNPAPARALSSTSIVPRGCKGYASLVHGALSPAECADIVRRSEDVGFTTLNYPGSPYTPDYRNNTRAIFTDASLAATLFQRIKALVPSTMFYRGALWTACGCNERFRSCRGQPGYVFGAHCDAAFARPDGSERSFLTVNIYLNRIPRHRAGRTLFLEPSWPAAESPSVQPEGGLALIFEHHLRHSGEKLLEVESGRGAGGGEGVGGCETSASGEGDAEFAELRAFWTSPSPSDRILRGNAKYLLRTDVMYARVVGDAGDAKGGARK